MAHPAFNSGIGDFGHDDFSTGNQLHANLSHLADVNLFTPQLVTAFMGPGLFTITQTICTQTCLLLLTESAKP